MIVEIWLIAAFLYVFFRLWYDGIGRPLSSVEVEGFMVTLGERSEAGLHTPELEVARKFLEADDGKEFIMVNLLKFKDSPVIDPVTGSESSARALLTAYFKPFMFAMFKRAGHPVFTAQIAGGYLDQWNTHADPGWSGAGLIRYRSRRDAMLSSLANPAFDDVYQYKLAALEQTYAVPTRRQAGFYASPRVTAALFLLLAAAFTQLALG